MALGPDDLPFLRNTGGTSSVTIGARFTHANREASALQAGVWL